jgi:TrkA-C domain
MIALVSLLVIITISIIVVRIGSVALVMTGLSKDLAVFQAQSAFSGVGFTTRESESVVRHPTRRRVIRLLMLMGNAGFTSAIAGLVLTFYGGSGEDLALRLGLVVLALAILWVVSTSKLMDRFMTRAIRAALKKWTRLDVRDYARLLELDKGYAVAEIEVGPEDWLCNHRLSELNLTREGILVLGVRRAKGNYVGAPYGQMEIMVKDVLTCYGPEKILRELPHRLAGSEGNHAHTAAVQDQEQIRAKESIQ